MAASPRTAVLLVLTGALATILAAWGFQLAGYAPCELCLMQRWPYYGTIFLAALLILPQLGPSIVRAGLVLLGLAFLGSCALGIYHAGVEWVRKSLVQRLDRPADAVITTGGGYPLDLTFYQCVKGITAAAHMVRPGGRILMVGACQEGVGGQEFAELMARYPSDAEFLRGIEGVPVTVDQWQLEKLALVTQKMQVLYAAPGVPEEYQRRFWGRGFANPQDAVDALVAGLDPGARIAVVPDGPYVLAHAGVIQ